MVPKEDLSLALGLNITTPLHLNLMSSPSSDQSLNSYRSKTRSFLKGIDVNCFPPRSFGDADEEGGVSSTNSTISTVSGKRSERETTGGSIDGERACISDDEDGENSRKKLRLSKDQAAILEESFKEKNTLNPKQKLALAKRLGLRARQVEVWFQNRRARTKLKQTEVDCEYLKSCCENLTEENRRLMKEVQELRAMKLSPQLYMQMAPPTTLAMCPSCERMAVPSSGAAVDRRSISLASAQARPFAFNPWVGAAVQRRPFDALHSQS